MSERKSAFAPAMLRAFTKKDLGPISPHWKVNGPNFVGVGVGRAGTTWWYSLLLKHPQVVGNRLNRKELHFFDHLKLQAISAEQIEAYREAFAAPEGKICGEWSGNYLNWPLGIENLVKTVPDTKILVMLRNPIDRSVSGINWQQSSLMRKFVFDDDAQYIFQTYAIFPGAITRSLYLEGLRRLLQAYPRERILVLQFEKCKRDPANELARTYQFLGVEDSFVPSELTRTVNRIEYVVSRPDDSVRRLLADYFRRDVEATLELFPEIDKTLWSDFVY